MFICSQAYEMVALFLTWFFVGYSLLTHEYLEPIMLVGLQVIIDMVHIFTYWFLKIIYNFHTGLFTENCFVLAEGFYEDEVFHISAFGFPPPEPASITR